jgi:hypothetical protein
VIPEMSDKLNSTGPIKTVDERLIAEQLTLRKPLHSALADEVQFILKSALDKENIQIHDIQTRVKSIKSTVEKCKNKEMMDNSGN